MSVVGEWLGGLSRGVEVKLPWEGMGSSASVQLLVHCTLASRNLVAVCVCVVLHSTLQFVVRKFVSN